MDKALASWQRFAKWWNWEVFGWLAAATVFLSVIGGAFYAGLQQDHREDAFQRKCLAQSNSYYLTGENQNGTVFCITNDDGPRSRSYKVEPYTP